MDFKRLNHRMNKDENVLRYAVRGEKVKILVKERE